MRDFAKTSLCGTLLAAGLFLVLMPVRGAASTEPVYTGSLRGTYDYRRLGSDHDQDVYGYWHLRGRNLADNKTVDVYTSGRLHQDVDGVGSSYSSDPFISSDDNSNSDNVRVLQAYVDWHDPKKTMSLRGGRQYVDVADYIQMDGLQAMLYENKQLGGRVFGGQPVSYYSSTDGDIFAGASLVGKPWEGNRSRATYARYQDDSESAADDHYIFDTRQQMTEEIRMRGYLSLMNEDVQMGGLDLYYFSMSDKVFDAVAGARRWGNYDADTRAYSPLVQTLGDQEPYTTGYGNCTAQILPWFYLSPGAMVRVPDESNYTNRRFERYDLNFIFEPTESLRTSIALEYWDVEDDDRFFGLSGDIRYSYRKIWDVSAGAAYLDYSYRQFNDFSLTADGGSTIASEDGTLVQVSPYAFTYYLRGKWNISKNLALRLAGEIEDDSEESDLGYRIRTSFEVRL